MTMPWNKHSSTWEVKWEDRWEQKDFSFQDIKKRNFKNAIGGSIICLGFWGLVATIIIGIL